MNGLKKVLVIAFILIALTISLVLGIYMGEGRGEKKVEKIFAPIVNSIFPAPPAEIKSLGGKINNINNSSVSIEIYNPDDYLPHTDGTDRAKETRTANVLNSTRILLLDYDKIDSRGNPKTTVIKISNLKIGDNITVRSETNIKYSKTFDASEILLVK